MFTTRGLSRTILLVTKRERKKNTLKVNCGNIKQVNLCFLFSKFDVGNNSNIKLMRWLTVHFSPVCLSYYQPCSSRVSVSLGLSVSCFPASSKAVFCDFVSDKSESEIPLFVTFGKTPTGSGVYKLQHKMKLALSSFNLCREQSRQYMGVMALIVAHYFQNKTV